MKTSVLLRKIHHWGSIIVAIPMIVMIVAGLFLMLKKDIDWIQPPTSRGISADIPVATFHDMFEAVKQVPEANIKSWDELDRVDLKPDRGVVKFVAHNRWEVQVDAATGEVLAAHYRRSDLIETLHDGSWFADWMKLYVFFPVGIVLLVLWLTGVYMFFYPYFKRAQKRRKAS